MPAAPHEAAAIVCFVVAPDFRRRGVSRTLLTAGIANLAERGVVFVDAYPWNVGDGDATATDHYHGPRRMFESAGFGEIAAGFGCRTRPTVGWSRAFVIRQDGRGEGKRVAAVMRARRSAPPAWRRDTP